MTMIDNALVPESQADKARREYVWIFQFEKGTFDPGSFLAAPPVSILEDGNELDRIEGRPEDSRGCFPVCRIREPLKPFSFPIVVMFVYYLMGNYTKNLDAMGNFVHRALKKRSPVSKSTCALQC